MTRYILGHFPTKVMTDVKTPFLDRSQYMLVFLWYALIPQVEIFPLKHSKGGSSHPKLNTQLDYYSLVEIGPRLSVWFVNHFWHLQLGWTQRDAKNYDLAGVDFVLVSNMSNGEALFLFSGAKEVHFHQHKHSLAFYHHRKIMLSLKRISQNQEYHLKLY